MKTTTTAARRLLREGNPVPGDAFPDAARDADGRAVLAGILASASEPAAPSPRSHVRAAALPGWPALRTRKVAVPAGIMAASLAGLLAVMLSATGGPEPRVASPAAGSGFATLIANLTAHPSAHATDAAAVLRQLADVAARQPAVPLGPVEYSELKNWGLDLGPLHYDLNYVSHETSTDYAYHGLDGSSLSYTVLPAGKKYTPGTIPLQQVKPSPAARARFAWFDPTKLPVDTAALRRHLIGGPYAPLGGTGAQMCDDRGCHPLPVPGSHPANDPVTDAIVNDAWVLMSTVPLSPAVHASVLRVLAGSAAQGLANAHFITLGTVTDRAGQAGVAIGYQAPDSDPSGTRSSLRVLVFNPATGAPLGDEYASCKVPVGSYPAAASCTPTSYGQVLQVKAVRKIPAAPKLPPVPPFPALTTPPPTSASGAPIPQSSAQSGP